MPLFSIYIWSPGKSDWEMRGSFIWYISYSLFIWLIFMFIVWLFQNLTHEPRIFILYFPTLTSLTNPSQIHGLFFFIYNCYMCAYVNDAFWFHLVLLICICLRMTIWDWINYQEASMEMSDSPFLSSHWLPVTLHLGVGPWEIFPIHVGMLTRVVIV